MSTDTKVRSVHAPASFDEAAGTVEVVYATDAPVERDDHIEELVISDDAIDTSRLDAGAVNLIVDHLPFGLPLGRVVGHRVEDGKAIAVVKMTESDAHADILADIRAGVIKTVSVGYQIKKSDRRDDGGQPIRRVTRWMPAEISLVTIPADPQAQIRAATAALVRRTTIIERQQAMNDDGQKVDDQTDVDVDEVEVEDEGDDQALADDDAAGDDDQAPVDDDDESQDAARSARIVELCHRHQMPIDFAIRHIATGASVEAVRAEILDAMAERSPMHINTTRARVTRDAQETLVARAADALFSRLSGEEPSDRGRELRNLSTVELAREFVGSSARSMSRSEVISQALQTRSGMHTSSDFSAALGSAANRTLRAAYEAAELTYGDFVREATVPDFRATERVQIGDAPALRRREEGSETTYGTLSDSKEAIKLATFARALKMTRQMLINDDLGAFARILTSFGLRAGELKSDLVYGILTNNAKMSDGKLLFSASHNNVLSADLTVEGLSEARKAMRKQKSRDGASLNLSAKTLIVGPELETRAQQLLAPISASVSGEVNPFAASLKLAVDSRIEDDSWFLAANPALVDTIELAFLEGARGLQTQTIDEPMLDGVTVLAQIDVEAAAIDHLGLIKSKA